MQGDSESLFVEYDERKKAGESHKEAFAAAEAETARGKVAISNLQSPKRGFGVGASASVVNAERESRASSGGATSRKRNLKTNVVAHFFDAASEERPFGGGERGRTRVFLRFTTTLQTLQHATRIR